MCGICGVHRRLPGDEALVEAMAARMVHRGPDDAGFYADETVVLGVRRLKVIDIQSGHQPIADRSGNVHIVLNGEIYNYRALREELARLGLEPRTESDTEVALLAYLAWDEAFLEHLNGMFALAIWDRDRLRLLLARDRLGKKPLYVASRGHRLLFASELKCLLLDPTIARTPDLESCWHYLALGYIPGPRTMLHGIHRLLPGHVLLADPLGTRFRPYWRLPNPTPCLGRKRWNRIEDAVGEFKDTLREAVRKRMVADVPVGAFLSGGIDSSTVCALMAEVSGTQIKTFSVGFPSAGALDESGYASRVATHLGTDHTTLTLDVPPPDLLEGLAWHLDEPLADAAAIPTLLLSRLARQTVTVALTGEGADEILAGYDRYRLHRWVLRLRRALGAPTLAALGHLLPRGASGHSWRRVTKLLASSVRDPAQAYAEFLAPDADGWPNSAAGEALREVPLPANHVTMVLREPHGESWLGAMQYADQHTWLPDDLLVKVDRTTMATSLEARCPYLDHQLVELCALLPDEWKVGRGKTKRVLRMAARDLLPREARERHKHVFAVPIAEWLRGPWRDFAGDLLAPGTVRQHGLIDPDVGHRLLTAHVAGTGNYARPLWTLMALQLWAAAFIPRPGGDVAI